MTPDFRIYDQGKNCLVVVVTPKAWDWICECKPDPTWIFAISKDSAANLADEVIADGLTVGSE